MSQLSVFSSRYQLRHHSKIKRHIHFHLIFYSCFYFRNIAYCFNCLYVKYTILFRRNKNVLFVCLNPTGGKNIQIGKFMENPKKKKKRTSFSFSDPHPFCLFPHLSGSFSLPLLLFPLSLHDPGLESEDATLTLCANDFNRALDILQPSVSEEELHKYKLIEQKLTAK